MTTSSMERTEQLSQLYRLLYNNNQPDRYKVTAEKEVQDTSGGVWGCPPDLEVTQEWGVQGVD